MIEILWTVIVAVFSAVLSAWLSRRISYSQGIEQGKRLALHEKSVSVLTEIRKRMLALREEWEDWVFHLPSEDEERAKKLLSKQRELGSYYEENKLVLSNNMQRKIESVIKDIDRKRQSFFMNLMASNFGNEDEKRNREYRAGAEVSKWLEHEFSKSLEDLDSHLRELIGADKLRI